MESKVIGILGTGDYGRALAKRLQRAGYDVVMGSRYPSRRALENTDQLLSDTKIETIESVLTNADIQIVFLAIHSSNFKSLLSPFEDYLSNKIFIDISNRTKPSESESNAENLLRSFPDICIVKGFNTLSAYAVENDLYGGNRRVFIASNNITAREKVVQLSREMGLSPVDCGSLLAARELESYPLKLMSGWGLPSLFTFFTFIVWLIITLVKVFIYYSKNDISVAWDSFPLTFLNKPICLTAITLLALSYLPGCLAAFLQICNGTKYKRFPKWFDRWMKARKMLGLYALFFTIWHVGISVVLISPGYARSWYQRNDYTNTSTDNVYVKMNLKAEATISVGFIALLLMTLIGLSSLPSVGEILNWKEWRFSQSHLGYLALLLTTSHVVIIAINGWISKPSRLFYSNTFLCCLIPFITLFLKLVLIMPGISGYIDKIRSGWQRKVHTTVADVIPLYTHNSGR